ncbi:sugar ABC transporter substrate-binding protein [Allonocardiopsis opalescens]|uniref:Monosaccharide ABC transporter substrate-binding protein (CUT2 family) n=1 Tax=Allonocardiopsis opalescens TaxID=1144618 RepID=A0A2T0PV66_9ACTN|nr:sugar ABC transporter substrate-binding protein [Allonocardiopsis opalescens]PRX95421.1 monosaccharide ABC transporter substrate-binding protein (CUT2 family) [Allonocardiopsis opalescens]
MTRTKKIAGALLALPLLATACSGGEADGADASVGPVGELTIAMVTHANPGDLFWDVVRAGLDQAASDHGITTTYQGSGEPAEQAQFIETAISQDVDGLIVSMANPDALRGSVEQAVEAGIPVITINSGAEVSAEFGAMAHVGQTESVAGEATGERLTEEGLTNVLCVVHEAGNVGLEERCAGAASTFDGEMRNVQVQVSDLGAAAATIAAELQSDDSIDGVLTLNNGVAGAAVDALGTAARDDVGIATFDVDSDVLAGITAGDILFAVDQQPYLQGYLPVTMLYLYAANGNTVGGGQPVLTGPGFVDASNVEQVTQYAEQGTR